jgi:hypothetical protein
MAVGVLMTLPGVKQEQYEQINERLFGHYPFDASDAPDGLLVHSAGPTADGWYVYDIWETKDHFKRFGEDRLGPAVRDTFGADFEERRPDFYEIAHLVDVRTGPGASMTVR